MRQSNNRARRSFQFTPNRYSSLYVIFRTQWPNMYMMTRVRVRVLRRLTWRLILSRDTKHPSKWDQSTDAWRKALARHFDRPIKKLKLQFEAGLKNAEMGAKESHFKRKYSMGKNHGSGKPIF